MEIVTLAVYLLGGDSGFVDTEDIAVKANALAPGRFSWLKYVEQINIHTIKTHLWDAKSDRKGRLLLGSEKEGWMLTSGGLALARARLNRLQGVDKNHRKRSRVEEKWVRTERVRMLGTDAYRKFAAAGAAAVTRDEAEAFFRLNSYIVGEARKRKIERILNTFGANRELKDAVRALAERVKSEDSNA